MNKYRVINDFNNEVVSTFETELQLIFEKSQSIIVKGHNCYLWYMKFNTDTLTFDMHMNFNYDLS